MEPLDSQMEEGTSNRASSADENSSRSSSRTENATAHVTSGGTLDLSGLRLTSLSNKFSSMYAITEELDISKNKFQSVNMNNFRACRRVDISDNMFSSLSSFLPLSRRVNSIIANDNRIKLASSFPFQDFVALNSLQLARNGLQTCPALKLHNLRSLHLNDNEITDFPDLSGLPFLESLFLRNNKIQSLEYGNQKLPNSLQVLDISENPIHDLCEVYHLERAKSIVNLSIESLPCLSNFSSYHYRSFLLVIFPSLLFINNTDVNEIESFNAEFLTLRGNLTGFQSKFAANRGDNEHLAEFLKINSVATDESGIFPKDEKLYKMMIARSQSRNSVQDDKRTMSASISNNGRKNKENRRKSFAAPKHFLSIKSSDFDSPDRVSTDDDLSVHSPFGNYIAKLGKENQHPSELHSSRHSSPRQKHPRSCQEKNRLDYVSPTSSGILKGNSLPSRDSEGSLSSSTLVMSSDTQRSNCCSRSLFSPVLSKDQVEVNNERELSTPVKDWVSAVPQLVSSPGSKNNSKTEHDVKVLDLTFTKEIEDIVQLKAVIDELYHQNLQLYQVQDNLSVTMQDMQDYFLKTTKTLESQNQILTKKIQALEEKMIVPVPSIHVANRNSEGDEISASWQVKPVQGFNLILDGQVVGTVKGTSARITDVTEADHSLQVQAIGWDGSLGKLSNKIDIPARDFQK